MAILIEVLESRRLLTAAQDITALTNLRQDPVYSAIDGSDIGIAVLDSGTWANHPDLRNNFAAYFDAVKQRATEPGSTVVTDARDPDGHGTHVAGTALSSNPDIGVATRAKLIAVRTLPAEGEAQPSFNTVANALQWVLNNVRRFNIKVVNLSLGVPSINDNTGTVRETETTLIRRLEDAGVTVVAAAGNNYADFAPRPGAATPAAYSTLVVSNTWADSGRNGTFPIISGSGGNVRFFAQENDAAPDRFAATSQRSTLPGQIAAPGSQILSTWNDPNKLYQFDSGTSMSSPFVSGAVALMQETAWMFGGRYLTPDQVRTVLLTSADTITDTTVSTNSRIPVSFDASGNPRRAGSNQDLPETGLTFKRIDVYAAVRATRALVTTGNATPDPDPDPQPPSGTDPDATPETASVVPNLDGSATFNFSGRIGTDGPVSVGGGDVDLYKLTVLSPGAISATLNLPGSGTPFSPAIRLFDSAGTPIQTETGGATSYPSLTPFRVAPGTYYVGVSAAGNTGYTISPRGGTAAPAGSTGDYGLTIGLSNPDPNGVIQGAAVADLLSPNATDPNSDAGSVFFRGTTGSDPNPFDENLPRVQIGATDVDMFRLSIPDDGTLNVTTLGRAAFGVDGIRTFIRVFDATGAEVAAFRQQSSSQVDAIGTLAVQRGDVYFVGISTTGNTVYDPASSFERVSTTGETGSYQVYFSLANGDANGTAFDATSTTVGAALAGSIGRDGTAVVGNAITLNANASKDVDFYRLVVPATGLIDLQVVPDSANPDFRPVLALWRLSADNTEITRDADTTGRAPRVIAPAQAGETIYFSITGDGNDDFKWFALASGSGGSAGAYSLTSSVRPASALRTLTNSSLRDGTPTEVFANSPVYANLGTTNAVETGPASVNLYRYVATFTGPLVIRASVPTDQPTDPYLRLFDSAAKEIAFNDDADATTRDAQITYQVVAGRTYFIGVNPSSEQARAYNPVTGDGAAPGLEGDYVLQLTVPPRLTLSGGTVTQVNNPAADPVSVVTFTMSLAEPTGEDVSADFGTFDPGGPNSAVAGTDYTPVTTRLTIPRGQTSATVTVPFVLSDTPGRVRLIGGALSNLGNARKGALTAVATVLPAVATPEPTTAADVAVQAVTVSTALPGTPIVPGDRLNVAVTLASPGGTTLAGRFSMRTVLSADAFASGDDILLNTRALTLRLSSGRTIAQRLSALVPSSLEAGTYRVITTLTPVGTPRPGTPAASSADAQPLNNTAPSDPFSVQWIFGTFPGHRGKTLTLPSADGTPITFSIRGPGQGTITRDDSNLLSAVLSDTTRTSILTLTPARRTTAAVLNLNVTSPLRQLLSTQVSVLGDLTLPSPAPLVRVLGR